MRYGLDFSCTLKSGYVFYTRVKKFNTIHHHFSTLITDMFILKFIHHAIQKHGALCLKNGVAAVFIILVSLKINAKEVAVKEYQGNPPERINVAEPVTRDKPLVSGSTPATGNAVSLDINQLKAYPELVKKALLSSLLSNNENGVSLLLPIFKQQEPENRFYIHWSEAIIAYKNSAYSKAIALYHKVIIENPQAAAARLQLAIVLYENYDSHAAKKEFEIVKQQKGMPEHIVEFINSYLQVLHKRQEWKFRGNLNYLDDNNVNNAPKAGTRIGFWSTAKPESARGIGYYTNARKKIQLASNIFYSTVIDGFGKYYITNHKYDEATLRFASGIGYQNAKTEITLLPFIEQRWYSGGNSTKNQNLQRYSHSLGTRAEINHWLGNNWSFFGAIEYGEQRYINRDYLDGNNVLFSVVLAYFPDIRQYWFIGNDYYQENTTAKDNAYTKKSVRAGWVQKWPYGISTRLIGSYAWRNYFGKDFFGITRNHDEYTALLSVWHEDFNFLGLTPRIVLSYQKNDSNHPFYQYDKKRVYLELEKEFR